MGKGHWGAIPERIKMLKLTGGQGNANYSNKEIVFYWTESQNFKSDDIPCW